jgi:nucleoside-diphosphate-sugar epimerase
MRVVITGATGNVGTSVIQALTDEPLVDSIVGVARRRPSFELPGVEWVTADVAEDDLRPIFEGADAVVHLAWLIQPSHDLHALSRTNVRGSQRVFAAAGEAGVGVLVHASSVGAYSPGSKDALVREDWPVEGIRTSFYSRHKARCEHELDLVESRYPEMRVVRLRPALIFKREAASGIRRLFMGPLAPGFAFVPGRIPAVPDIDGRLVLQCVHSLDVGHAYRLAIVNECAHGAFNIATDPVLDTDRLCEVLQARRMKVSTGVARRATDLTWKLHLQPTPAGWVDLALQSPLLDSTRAREVLGWEPMWGAEDTLLDLLAGLHEGAGLATPPLDAKTAGPLRVGEVLAGVGSRGGVERE